MSIYSSTQQKIAEKISADSELSVSKWTDWHWQLQHSITRIDTFERLLDIQLKPLERHQAELTLKKYPLSLTPYYLSLIDRNDFRHDPIFRQSFPDPAELKVDRFDRPAYRIEDRDSPIPGIVQRYPDQVEFHISHACAMYCRQCTHKRKVGDIDSIPDRNQIRKGIRYIRNRPKIRNVLLTGGDPLMLNDLYLDWVLTELRKIDHVQAIHIDTRMPVILPYRITDGLVEMLKKHQPLWLSTHFNHPREMTSSSRAALSKLADAGIPLTNQSVLLSGVNDCQRLIKSLLHKLVENRVRPTYLYQCDLSEGLSHFRTRAGKGIEILESLIGHTSRLAVPTYVIDAPGGREEAPLKSNYLTSLSGNQVLLRNNKGVIATDQGPGCYHEKICSQQCSECELQLKFDDGEETDVTSIEMLLSD